MCNIEQGLNVYTVILDINFVKKYYPLIKS